MEKKEKQRDDRENIKEDENEVVELEELLKNK